MTNIHPIFIHDFQRKYSREDIGYLYIILPNGEGKLQTLLDHRYIMERI